MQYYLRGCGIRDTFSYSYIQTLFDISEIDFVNRPTDHRLHLPSIRLGDFLHPLCRFVYSSTFSSISLCSSFSYRPFLRGNVNMHERTGTGKDWSISVDPSALLQPAVPRNQGTKHNSDHNGGWLKLLVTLDLTYPYIHRGWASSDASLLSKWFLPKLLLLLFPLLKRNETEMIYFKLLYVFEKCKNNKNCDCVNHFAGPSCISLTSSLPARSALHCGAIY